MKTKITLLVIVLILSVGVNIYQFRLYKNTKLELSIADEALTLCDVEVEKQEYKLGIVYQIINEYEILFPASFMKAMYIDDSKIVALHKQLK